jgi:hypothetical protein
MGLLKGKPTRNVGIFQQAMFDYCTEKILVCAQEFSHESTQDSRSGLDLMSYACGSTALVMALPRKIRSALSLLIPCPFFFNTLLF